MRRTWRRVVDRAPDDAFTYALAAVAALAGVLVAFVGTELFPHLSLNHDEGVYLQQAAMLLDGKLWLEPPVPEAVRPWFFVEDGSRLYPKYSPVPAAAFATGLALGLPRLPLVLVAVGNAALVGALAGEAFDRRTGLVAAALLLTAPLFALTSSTFLSYAPTTLFNLLFALGYVRAHRRSSRRYAVLAGVAVGLAFFARPLTALLFALPFVGHALVTLGAAWRRSRRRETVVRLGTIAALGTAFVALTLGYNRLLTGDPLVFPYQAFAPHDGIGFGHREILDHERHYTPDLALEANRRVLRQLLTRWGPLGALGSVLAALGLATGLVAPLRRRFASARSLADEALADLTLRALVASLFVTVAAGNVLFWGNLNVLADLQDPTDGLIAHLGPFYHFDLLLPLSVFGAAGVVAIGERVRSLTRRFDRDAAGRVAMAVVLVAGLAVAATAAAGAFGPPVDRNAEYRADHDAAYEPFAATEFDRALVFVPTPYGAWLNHPFQWTRNDPEFEGDAVYVQDRHSDGDFSSLDAFPDRRPYRFTYRGDWPRGDEFRAVLRPLTVRSGDRLRIDTRVGVVAGAQAATVRIESEGEAIQYGVERLDGERETVSWVVGGDGARVVGEDLHRYGDDATVPVDETATVALSVTFTQPGGSTITYRQEVDVESRDGGVRALWPPENRVCRLTPDCDREGTYVDGGDYAAGVSLSSNATSEAENS